MHTSIINKNKSVIALTVIILVISGCAKKLDKSPLDKFDNATFWTSEANVQLALAGVYRGNILTNTAEYNPTDWWSYNGLIWLEMATDNAYDRRLDNSAVNRLTNGTLINSNANLGYYYTNSYLRIARCNYFLENIDKAATLNETSKKRMIAEVRFIRACQYYYMAQYWGSVPLVTKSLSSQEANTLDKATHQVLADFVISEFKAASLGVPRHKDIPAAETGRASRQAVLAFLGRMQLAEGLFADAAATYKTIVSFGDNIIDPNYSSIFLEANENSSENIFSIQFIPNLLANAIMQHHLPGVLGGFEVLNPLASLMEAYQFTDGTPFSYTDPRYDYRDIGKNRDPRLKYTILYNNAPIKNVLFISHPDSTNSQDQIQSSVRQTTQTGYGMKKYMDETFSGNLQTGYGGNIPIVRYAEVLLSYLEATLEAGQPVDQALLDATINKVRGRASVNMPKITITDANALRPVLRNERRVELALEGLRYIDLLRWKIADQVLKGDFYGHPYPVTVRALRKKGTTVDPYKRWYVTTKNFRKGIDEHWPIPLAEVNINPKLQ